MIKLYDVFDVKSVDRFKTIFLKFSESGALNDTGISFNNLISPFTLISENTTS
ncbi:hypothetical protein HOG27_02515 [bacterium]|nr:hypothetical protein [bacterium]